jgi:hypothetical protein
MTAFPKLPGKPECLGFRKTIVLNKEEHELLNYLVEDKLKWCQTHFHRASELSAVMNVLIDIEQKLNSITPPPN